MHKPNASTIRFDPVGGIAGDMFIAACLDAWPEFRRDVVKAIRSVDDDHPRLDVSVEPTMSCGLTALSFTVQVNGSAMRPSGAYSAIVERLTASPLPDAVRRHALGILTTLADAEAVVHGIAREDVHFHELADWDSIADIVGAATIIAKLDGAIWECGPLPLGGGRISGRHGALPVPAPATVVLCSGFHFIDDGNADERVTPTGAAILRYLGAGASGTMRSGRLARFGTGAGTRRLSGVPNILRVLAFEAEQAGDDESVVVVTFEVDDQSPEDLAIAVDAIRETNGVLDVATFTGAGKKGRLVHHLQAIALPAARSSAIEACLMQTSTLGLRWRLENRRVLAREHHVVPTEDGPRRVKLAHRPCGGVTAKIEADELSTLGDFATRRHVRRCAESIAEQIGDDR